MHENRETSETPAVKTGSGTAGEGPGRTARMHVPEESDSGAVPMNHSNKDEKLLAESEEGRPLIKENILQPSTHSTQSENPMAKPKSTATESEISRDCLAELLNEDLSREYQAIIAYVVYSQVLSGASAAT